MIARPESSSMEKAFLEYEVAASLIAPLVSFGWGQEIMSSYFARKTARKVRRYREFLRNKRKHTHNPAVETTGANERI